MDLINGYQIVEKIGEGAFGETFLAEKDDQQVVIKQLKINQIDHWKAIERFQREAELMKQLNHPGIPHYIDFIKEEQFTGIVQQYIDGKTLEEIIKHNPDRLTPPLIESILKQGLEILDYLQSFSPPIIHRDISPKNMILNPENHLYLIDFELQRHHHLYGNLRLYGSRAVKRACNHKKRSLQSGDGIANTHYTKTG